MNLARFELDRLAAMIRERCGLRSDTDDGQALAAALDTRLAATGSPNATAYLTRLAEDTDEFQAVINLITVNETYFFREPEQISFLVRRARAMLADRAAGQPIGILCAGCSSGEEPYSVAIALNEAFGADARRLFRVLAVDIDSGALAKARRGIYGERSFRGVPPGMRERHFHRHEAEGWALDPAIRASVEFRHVNLLADPLGELGPFHAVLFRNVSIYFDAPTRRQVISRFADLLVDRGCLIVGAAETLSNDFGVLSLAEHGGVFFFVKGDETARRPPPRPRGPAKSATAVKPVRPATPPSPPRPMKRTRPSDRQNTPADAVRLVREERYDEALSLVDGWPAGPGRHRIRAQILFNRNEPRLAEREAEAVLASDPWCVDTLVLLAQIARQRQDAEKALHWLKQAVYARPEAWLPHFYLAETYRRSGRFERARREYAVVVQQLSASEASSTAALQFPPGVAPADILRLCQRNLEAITVEQGHGA
jgi:chemotaxis protein methyltransferase CheR